MNYLRWWGSWRFNELVERLSIIDLINLGTLDLKMASLLWMFVQYRMSLIVAAGPSFAGKTTLLNALLDFLPPDIEKIHLQGCAENFLFVNRVRPEKVYLVADEISNHAFEYLWGYKARRTFELLNHGFTIGGTIHARSAGEVVYILHKVIGLHLALVSQLGAIITLRLLPGESFEDEPVRLLDSVSLVFPSDEGVTIKAIAFTSVKDRVTHFVSDKMLASLVTLKIYHGKSLSVNNEINQRMKILEKLQSEDVTSCDDVRNAVLKFYCKA